MLNVSGRETETGRSGGVGDTGLSLWPQTGGLPCSGVRGGEGCSCTCRVPAKLRLAGRVTVEPQPPCPPLLALQDELSHINARLNMGILGCEYGPTTAPTAVPKASPCLSQLLLSPQPMTHSRSSSAKEPLWATRALCGVSVSTPWGTCSSVALLTRPSRWVGSCLGGLGSLAGEGWVLAMGGSSSYRRGSLRKACFLIPTVSPLAPG